MVPMIANYKTNKDPLFDCQKSRLSNGMRNLVKATCESAIMGQECTNLDFEEHKREVVKSLMLLSHIPNIPCEC